MKNIWVGIISFLFLLSLSLSVGATGIDPTKPGEEATESISEAEAAYRENMNPETDFEYTIFRNRATIVKYNGTRTEVVVPYEVAGCPVIYVATGSFDRADLVSVSLHRFIEEVEEMSICTGCKVILNADTNAPDELEIGETVIPATRVTQNWEEESKHQASAAEYVNQYAGDEGNKTDALLFVVAGIILFAGLFGLFRALSRRKK